MTAFIATILFDTSDVECGMRNEKMNLADYIEHGRCKGVLKLGMNTTSSDASGMNCSFADHIDSYQGCGTISYHQRLHQRACVQCVWKVQSMYEADFVFTTMFISFSLFAP